MNTFFRFFPMMLGIFLYNISVLSAGIADWCQADEQLTFGDSLSDRVFENERDFSYFIVADLGLKNPYLTSTSGDTRDSLYTILNRDKEIVVPMSYLSAFSDYIMESPLATKIMSQTVDISSKDKLAKFSFEVSAGDEFFLRFDLHKGVGRGMYVEVLFNEVKIENQLSLKRNTEFVFDYEASKPGKIDVILRNFGFLRLQGNLDVEILPRKQKIKFQEVRVAKLYEKEEMIVVKDTLFSILIDDSLKVSHRLNLRGNAVFQKQLAFDSGKEILGFAVFIYPLEEKQKLEFQRRETYKEDGLQDFAWKELLQKSYTYLPEFKLNEIDFSVYDASFSNHWINGQQKKGNGWILSSNSKRNYAFFEVKEDFEESKIMLRIANKSALYDQELWLQVVAIFVDRFKVMKLVKVEEFETIIRLSLI